MRDKVWPLITFSKPSATPFGETMGGGMPDSEGVVGCEDKIALPSSESASKSSGGRRSFSISDLRLLVMDVRRFPTREQWKTYASSKPLIASLIPSEPEARVPYGSLLEPVTLFNSDTFSDSSLNDVKPRSQ